MTAAETWRAATRTTEERGGSVSVVGIVLGVLALFLGLLMGIPGLICGIVGVVKGHRLGWAAVGVSIVCSVIGVAAGLSLIGAG